MQEHAYQTNQIPTLAKFPSPERSVEQNPANSTHEDNVAHISPHQSFVCMHDFDENWAAVVGTRANVHLLLTPSD